MIGEEGTPTERRESNRNGSNGFVFAPAFASPKSNPTTAQYALKGLEVLGGCVLAGLPKGTRSAHLAIGICLILKKATQTETTLS